MPQVLVLEDFVILLTMTPHRNMSVNIPIATVEIMNGVLERKSVQLLLLSEISLISKLYY